MGKETLMDKEQRDELLALAQAALSEIWCLHPNGTSVWTGEEYTGQLVAHQHPVCNAVLPLDEIEVRRMEFIAGCNPNALIELLEFYGLSDTKLERGPEDNDEVCVTCGHATTEGHTHQECFKRGKTEGATDENIDCANRLCEALGSKHRGFFDNALLQQVAQLRQDAQLLAAALESRDDPLSDAELDAFNRVCGK